MDLKDIRDRLSQLDGELLALMAERQRLSQEVARVKRATGRPTRDFARERDVILNARARAQQLGLSPAIAEQILRLMIRSSLTTQEQARVAAEGLGAGRRALIIGGAGKMGGWFADFLASQGFAIEIGDPAGSRSGYPVLPDWTQSTLDQDVIVVATPLAVTRNVLGQLAERRPPGLVFDIGSIKTPLREGLQGLIKAGVRTTSIHPMFGPSTELLSGRHILHVDLGHAEAVREGQDLFSATMAVQVVTSLDDHDRLIAYVLGLSHAINIAFFTALAESGEAAPRLLQMSSTTFDAQFDVATLVASESPALYYEIQRLNEHGSESLKALSAAVDRLCATVESGDAAGFEQLMLKGRAYIAGRTSTRA